MRRRRVLYVTGTRAEFGLMRQTLAAIKSHPALQLQLVVTGMHLSRAHGHTIDGIRADGWTIDAKIPWKDATAQAAGDAMRRMADAFDRLKPDIVLLAGDRVEPFSAAGAAALARPSKSTPPCRKRIRHGGVFASGPRRARRQLKTPVER